MVAQPPHTSFQSPSGRSRVRPSSPGPRRGWARRPVKRRRFTLNADDLGKSALENIQLLIKDGLTFQELCHHRRGPTFLQARNSKNHHHPAQCLIQWLRSSGAPVLLSSRPWSLDELQQALRHGSHVSARHYSQFLRSEMATMAQQGFWVILPASIALSLPGVRFAPIGVVPQRNRRPRTIVDYSFWGLNDESLRTHLPNSMQFGRTFDRLLYRLETADTRHGPIFIMKADISDGFYRIPLQLDSIPKLGALLPRHPNEEQLVAFPTVLPMGWTNSPPLFCIPTETITDLANERFQASLPMALPPHRLEGYANTKPVQLKKRPSGSNPPTVHSPPPKVKSRGRLRPPLAYADCFIDDIIALAQGSRERRTTLQRILFESVDSIVLLVLMIILHTKNPTVLRSSLLGMATGPSGKLSLAG